MTTASMASPARATNLPVPRSGGPFRVGFLLVQKRGKKGIYNATGWHGSRHFKRSLKTTNKTEAAKRATALLTDLFSSASPTLPTVSQKPQNAVHLLADVVSEYMEVKRFEGRKQKTIYAYGNALRDFQTFCSARGVTRFDQVTRQLYDEYLKHLRGTLNHDRTIKNRCLNLLGWANWTCTKRDYCVRSPFHGASVPRSGESVRFCPKAEDLSAMLSVASPHVAPLLRVLAFTGLRLGEFVHLRVEDVDLDNRSIHVRARKTPHPWSPKSNRDRVVPIATVLMRDLASQVAAAKAAKHVYLFGTAPSRRYPQGGHHLNDREVNEKLQAVAKKAGLPVGRAAGGFITHSLRRYFKTACLLSKVPPVLVDRWMGHKNNSMDEVYLNQDPKTGSSFIDSVTFV